MAFLPDGRMLITERPGRLRVFANGRLEPHAAGRRAQGRGHRPGRPARCLPASRLRAEPRALSLLFRRGRGRQCDDGGPRRMGRRRLARRHHDLRGPAARVGRAAFRLAHRLRPRRADVCDDRRALQQAARAGSRRSAAARWCACGTTARCRRTIPSSAGPARGRRSSPGAIAIRRASRCIPRPAGSGRSSTGRAAATSSTS